MPWSRDLRLTTNDQIPLLSLLPLPPPPALCLLLEVYTCADAARAGAIDQDAFDDRLFRQQAQEASLETM